MIKTFIGILPIFFDLAPEKTTISCLSIVLLIKIRMAKTDKKLSSG
jgi:hypothetical protein